MITIFAPAKVNLYLHVGPVREDGRHPLDSLVVFADQNASDRLTFEQEEQPIVLNIEGPGSEQTQLAADENNLVLRAARLLERETGREFTGKLTLEKHLPIAAGIGGGSSDAAATLRLLNRAYGLGYEVHALARLSVELGGDVPVCVSGIPSLMRGDGDRVELCNPLPPDLPALLVTPDIACGTPEVFKAFDQQFCPPKFEESPPPRAPMKEDWLKELKAGYSNDLMPAAVSLHSEIGVLLDRLSVLQDVQFHTMSGSGATCFAVFETADQVHEAARSLKSEFPDWFFAETVLGNAQFDLRGEHN